MNIEQIRKTDEYLNTRSNILQATIDHTLTEYMEDLKTRIKYGKRNLKHKSKLDKEQAQIRLQAYIDLYQEEIDKI